MKLQICHLSDFHFENNTCCTETLKERKDKIVNVIISNSAGYDYCLLAITGDVTYSCKDEDYIFAFDFFQDMVASIEKHYKKVYVFTVPGNHDCEISKSTSAVREVLINSIKESHNYNRDISQQITDAQNNYFEHFDGELTSQTWTNRMIFSEEISIEGIKLNVIGLNTAWLSQIGDEKDYYYPCELLPQRSNGDLVITMMHHPFHWYETKCYHAIRKNIENISNVVLTGHDHTSDARCISKSDTDSYIFSGGIFYKNGTQVSSFTIYNIDYDESIISGSEFKFNKGVYAPEILFENKVLHLAENKKEKLSLDAKYLETLYDIGVSITHSHKENFNIEDIFVWPTIKSLKIEKGVSEKQVKDIRSHIKTEKKVIFTGQESIGKTTLGKMLVSELYKDNIFVIMPDFTEIKNFSKDIISKIINNQIELQYGKDTTDMFFSGTDITRRGIIIDDLHKITMNEKSINDFFSMIEDMFEIVVVISNYSLEYFYYERANISILKYSFCEINEFSTEQINELVEKWIIAGRESDIDEKAFLRECDSAFKTIYSLMGAKNIMNRNPLNILLILNQWQINENFDTSRSAYAELCSSLINLNMHKLCNGDNDQIKKLDAILTQLSAYLYFNKNKLNDFDIDEFNSVCDNYKTDNLIEQNNKDALNLLIQGKFLKVKDIDSYKFKDRSVLYHYMAKYLAQNIDTQKDIIKRMVKHAYNEYNANVLLFLSSMSSEKYILDCLLEKMNEFLKLEDEFDFKSNEFDNSDEKLTTLSLPNNFTAKDARRESVKKLDDNRREANEYEDMEVSDEEINDLLNINSIVRCVQIIGQLVKNGFHNMNGETKIEILNDCYSLSLRTIKLIIKSIDSSSEEICKKMYENIKDGESKSFDEYKLIFDEFTIHIKKKVTLNLLMHTAHSTGSSELVLVYKALGERNNTLGYRFIGIITELCILNKVNEKVLIDFFNELKKEKLIFACDIMRIIVRTYLYLNDCDFNKRQRICSTLEIKYEPRQLLMSGRQHTKMD